MERVPPVKVRLPVTVQEEARARSPPPFLLMVTALKVAVPQVTVPESPSKVTFKPLGRTLPVLFKLFATLKVVQLAAVIEPPLRVKAPLMSIVVPVKVMLAPEF